MNKTISITELKTNTAKVLQEIKTSGATISVIQRSRLAAVILDPARYESLIEAQEDLEDVQALRDFDPSEPMVSLVEVEKKLGLTK